MPSDNAQCFADPSLYAPDGHHREAAVPPSADLVHKTDPLARNNFSFRAITCRWTGMLVGYESTPEPSWNSTSAAARSDSASVPVRQTSRIGRSPPAVSKTRSKLPKQLDKVLAQGTLPLLGRPAVIDNKRLELFDGSMVDAHPSLCGRGAGHVKTSGNEILALPHSDRSAP